MARALFVCLHNSGHSQMSEALLQRAAGGRHEARSAGTTPADRVHPEVVEAMAELDVDLGDRQLRRLSCSDAEWADIPGKRCLDWDLPAPKGQSLAAVRAMRDEIDERRVRGLVADFDAADQSSI